MTYLDRQTSATVLGMQFIKMYVIKGFHILWYCDFGVRTVLTLSNFSDFGFIFKVNGVKCVNIWQHTVVIVVNQYDLT